MTSKNILSKIWRLQYFFSRKCDDLCLKNPLYPPCLPGFRLSPEKFKIKNRSPGLSFVLTSCPSFHVHLLSVGHRSVGRSIDACRFLITRIAGCETHAQKGRFLATCNRDLAESIIGGPKMLEPGRLDAIQFLG
jgi:hypothetical protein